MATQTRKIGGFGEVEIYVSYDDQTMLITALRVINPTDNSVKGYVSHISTGRSASYTFQPHSDFTLAIPTGVQNRMQVSLDALSRIVGVWYEFSCPGVT